MKVKARRYKNWQGTGMDITVVYNPQLDGPKSEFDWVEEDRYPIEIDLSSPLEYNIGEE